MGNEHPYEKLSGFRSVLSFEKTADQHDCRHGCGKKLQSSTHIVELVHIHPVHHPSDFYKFSATVALLLHFVIYNGFCQIGCKDAHSVIANTDGIIIS